MVKSNEKGIVSKKQKRGGMWWVEHLAIPLFLAFIVSYGLPQVQYWLNISGAQTRDLYAKIDAIESEIKLAEDKYGSSLGSRFKDYLNQAEYHRWEAKKNLMNSDLRKTKIEMPVVQRFIFHTTWVLTYQPVMIRAYQPVMIRTHCLNKIISGAEKYLVCNGIQPK